MAGEPSTYDTLERMTRDMENQEAIALPQRRLASTANNRIQLTKPKQTQPNDAKGKNSAYYDPLTLNRKNTNDTLNLIDKSFENLPPTRRRTVQIKEIMAPQEPTENINHNNNFGGIDTHNNNRNEISRKRLAANEEEFTYLKEPRLQDPANTYHTNESSWNRHQYEEELRKAREQLQEYKEQLAETTIHCERLLNAKISEEKALENFQRGNQNTEEGYLELRDQVEILWNKSKGMDLALESDSIPQQQDEAAKLKALVHQLETELEQRNAELNEQNKATTGDARHVLDLYEDLTGVSVRDTMTKNGITSYKCVITGGNGTLHFALSIGRGSNAYVFYSPTLDRHRDSELLSKFPPFLKEDIEFARETLPNFFTKLSQCMNN